MIKLTRSSLQTVKYFILFYKSREKCVLSTKAWNMVLVANSLSRSNQCSVEQSLRSVHCICILYSEDVVYLLSTTETVVVRRDVSHDSSFIGHGRVCHIYTDTHMRQNVITMAHTSHYTLAQLQGTVFIVNHFSYRHRLISDFYKVRR